MVEDLHWKHLRELREDREDWRFEADGEAWFFGKEGAGRWALSVHENRYLLYRADHDSDISFSTIPDLVEWLDAHESERAWYPELQQEIGGHLLA